MADQPYVRASDADRERVAETLRRHCGEGRLTLYELDDRLGETYEAKTISQLRALNGPLRELPLLAAPSPVPWTTAQLRSERERAIDRSPDRRAKRGRTLGEHLGAYVLTSLLLVGIWALSGFGYFWPGWVIAVWGLGVTGHLGGHLARTRRSGMREERSLPRQPRLPQ